MALEMLVADLVNLLIPLWIILGLLVLLGTFALLSRVHNGRYIRPVVLAVAKVPILRRGMEKASNAALERSNPELASAMKKINAVSSNPNPQAMQKAMSRLTPAERRAYLQATEEQGEAAPNRQARRRVERMQQQARSTPAAGRPGRKRKRR